MTEVDVRAVALDCLLAVTEEEKFSHTVLNAALDKYAFLTRKDRAFLTRLFHGTLDYLLQLDAVTDRYASVKTKKMKPVLRGILRLSVYQILYMDRVPASAAVNEGVKLCQRRGLRGLSGFANAVLRHIAADRESILHSIRESGDLAFRYAVPAWMAALFEKQYGRERAERILGSFQEEKPVTVRLNRSHLKGKSPAEQAAAEQAYGEAAVNKCTWLSDVLFLSGFDSLEKLKLMQNGDAYVQDLSSVLDVLAAAPKPGETVFDICAAPGGKSVAAADLMENRGLIRSMDLSERKVQLIRENAARAGFSIIRPEVNDASVPNPALINGADLLLADLPCSGLGVLGGKPDLRCRASEEKCSELVLLQKKILDTAAAWVKPGGRLVYSTCTLNRAENEENLFAFEAAHPEFLPADLSTLLPALPKEAVSDAETMKNGFLTLLPGLYPGDGFFISVLKKKE